MAYGATAAITVDNATPKTRQKVTYTVTVTNSGTVDIVIDGVDPVSDASLPIVVGNVNPVGGYSHAGSYEATVGYGTKTVTSGGGTATFTFTAVPEIATTYYMNAVANGTRADGGTRIAIPTTAAVSIVATDP